MDELIEPERMGYEKKIISESNMSSAMVAPS